MYIGGQRVNISGAGNGAFQVATPGGGRRVKSSERAASGGDGGDTAWGRPGVQPRGRGCSRKRVGGTGRGQRDDGKLKNL